MAPGTDEDFPEPWRDDPGRSESRHHGQRDRDRDGVPDWAEDENYADVAPSRRYPPAARAANSSWFRIALGLIIVIIVLLILYFLAK